MAFSITSTAEPPTHRIEAGHPGSPVVARAWPWVVVLYCFGLTLAAAEPLSLCESHQAISCSGPPLANLLAIKNGTPSSKHPEVGLLLTESCPSGRCGVYAICSGVLAAADKFLTAAHCVVNREKKFWVFLRHAGIVSADPGGIRQFCDRRSDCDKAANDIAVLELSSRIEDVRPAQKGAWAAAQRVVIAGFGDTHPYRADNGILHVADVDASQCEPRTLCHLFGDKTPAACNHDSGGAMFANGNLVGIARRSENGCTSGRSLYVDLTDVGLADWWDDAIGQVRHSLFPTTGQLAVDCTRPGCWSVAGGGGHRHQIEVAATARLLRITANYPLLSPADHCGQDKPGACRVDYDLSLEADGVQRPDCD